MTTRVNYRMVDGARVSVLDFGATGDGTTDDTAAFHAAFNYCNATKTSLYIPNPSVNYRYSQVWADAPQFSIYGDSKTETLIHLVNTDFIRDPSPSTNPNRFEGEISDLRFSSETAKSGTVFGFVAVESNFRRLRFDGVGTAIELYGFGYMNNFEAVSVWSSNTGVRIVNLVENGQNSNNMFGCDFWACDYGYRDSGPFRNDKLNCFGCIFELCGVGVEVTHSRRFSFYGTRFEDNVTASIRVTDTDPALISIDWALIMSSIIDGAGFLYKGPTDPDYVEGLPPESTVINQSVIEMDKFNSYVQAREVKFANADIPDNRLYMNGNTITSEISPGTLARANFEFLELGNDIRLIGITGAPTNNGDQFFSPQGTLALSDDGKMYQKFDGSFPAGDASGWVERI